MKVRITYAPANQEPQSWEFDPDDIDNLESEQIEIVGGEMWETYAQWWFLTTRGNVRGARALLWTLLRRTNPTLDFNQIRFKTGDVGLQDVVEPVGKDEPDDTNTDSQSAQQDSPPDSESSTPGP